MKSIFYFCIVKSQLRHDAAANKQRFLCPNFLELDTERIKVCGSSNARKVSAVENLTAPCTLLFLTSNFQLL
jgi:hypothetical protein